jgi:hypothetical protein
MWCWWCCHTFDGEPLEMPKKYDELRKKFYTYGKFCSWSCMKAFAIDNYGVNLGGRIMGNIMCMRKQMYGVLGAVRMAPKRYELEQFGGAMTIEEFRRFGVIDKGPRKPVNMQNEHEVAISYVSPTTPSVVEETSDELKLVRKRPLKRSHNSLESALGLRIKPKQLGQPASVSS